MTREHATDFASELVRMAQAMTRLPEVETELLKAYEDIEAYAKSVQRLEIKLIDRNSEIETLHQTIRQLEVSRDDAELRFLEADDAKGTLVRVLDNLGKDILGALQAVQPLTKPTEDGELESRPTSASTVPSTFDTTQTELSRSGEGGQAVHATSDPTIPPSAESSTTHDGIVESAVALPADSSSGESVADPTPATTSTDAGATTETEPASAFPFAPTPTVEPSPPDASSSADIVGDAEPIHGPYFGKRYRDVPGFITKADWLAGGGTEEDYLGTWWPSVSNASHHS